MLIPCRTINPFIYISLLTFVLELDEIKAFGILVAGMKKQLYTVAIYGHSRMNLIRLSAIRLQFINEFMIQDC